MAKIAHGADLLLEVSLRRLEDGTPRSIELRNGTSAPIAVTLLRDGNVLDWGSPEIRDLLNDAHRILLGRLIEELDPDEEEAI